MPPKYFLNNVLCEFHIVNIRKVPCEICNSKLSILIKVLDPTFVLDDELVNGGLAGDEKRGRTDCRKGGGLGEFRGTCDYRVSPSG